MANGQKEQTRKDLEEAKKKIEDALSKVEQGNVKAEDMQKMSTAARAFWDVNIFC